MMMNRKKLIALVTIFLLFSLMMNSTFIGESESNWKEEIKLEKIGALKVKRYGRLDGEEAIAIKRNIDENYGNDDGVVQESEIDAFENNTEDNKIGKKIGDYLFDKKEGLVMKYDISVRLIVRMVESGEQPILVNTTLEGMWDVDNQSNIHRITLTENQTKIGREFQFNISLPKWKITQYSGLDSVKLAEDHKSLEAQEQSGSVKIVITRSTDETNEDNTPWVGPALFLSIMILSAVSKKAKEGKRKMKENQ